MSEGVSGSGFPTRPAQLFPWFHLGADGALRSCGERAPPWLRLPHRQQVVSGRAGRCVTEIGAVEIEELAHLVQPRMDAEPNAFFEREVLRVGLGVRRVLVIGRE